jgi:hypothetical protein
MPANLPLFLRYLGYAGSASPKTAYRNAWAQNGERDFPYESLRPRRGRRGNGQELPSSGAVPLPPHPEKYHPAPHQKFQKLEKVLPFRIQGLDGNESPAHAC